MTNLPKAWVGRLGTGLEGEMQCQKCGSENPDKSKFCGQCGCIIIPTSSPSISTHISNYLPTHISEKILASKTQVEGERKVITVLFTDVVNYTAFTEKLDIEMVHEIMNTYFKILLEIIYRYEGIVDQLLGDGMMVFFGAPLAHEDHAQRACRCAIEIQMATQKYSESIQKRYGTDFKVRVGINSGPVFVGTIGNDLHMEYLAVGNTVNLAYRIQNAATPGQILISGNTYHLVNLFFNFETIPDITVKGKEEHITAYALLDAKKAENRFDTAIVAGLSRFCGREVELVTLGKALADVEKGNGRVVGIMGEPGIGKSRLIREFRESLTPDEGSFFEGRCLHYGNSIPYRPVIDILKSFFRIEEEDNESIIKEKIIAKTRQLDEQLVNDLPFIFEVFSLNIQDKIHFNIEPEFRRNKMFSTTARLLSKESSHQSVIIIVEDLHWIDDITEELLAYLVQKLGKNPVMFLLAYRPEYSPPWKNQPGFSQIHLSQLSASSSNELLKSLLPDAEPNLELTTLVMTKAGGNPLFVEEYTYALLEEGRIQKEDGHYSLKSSLASLKLPDTLQGIISSRIDRLPENLKNTLQVASVIGRDFGYEVLRAVLQKPLRLRNQLENLEDLEFIIAGSTTFETGYYFKHALIQEVTYNGLSSKKQKELHENVARTIEKLYPDTMEEFLDALAYHFRHGLSKDKALDYVIRAGNKAKAVFANQEAIEYFKSALELCSKFGSAGDGISAKLHETLQEIYMLTGKYDQVLGSCEASYKLYEKFEDLSGNQSKENVTLPELLSKYLPTRASKQERLAALYFGRSQVCQWRRQTDEGLRWTDQGLDLPDISDQIKARLFWAKSTLFMQRGEYTTAIEYCNRAVGYAHKIQDEIEAAAYNYMGYIRNQSGDFKSAAVCYQRALEISILLKKPNPEAEALDSLAICFSLSGDWENAEIYYKKSLSISERIGSSYLQSRTLTNYSDLLIRRGHVDELEEAIACNIKALDVCGEQMNREGRPVIYDNLSWAYLKLGKMHEAREYGNKSMSIYLQGGFSKHWLCQGYLSMAEVHFGVHEIEKALDLCQKGLDMAIETNNKIFEGKAHYLNGKIYHDLSQWEKAEERLKESLRCFENISMVPDEKAHIFWDLAILYRDMNEANFRDIPGETIRELVLRAVEIFEKLGIYYDKVLAKKLSVS